MRASLRARSAILATVPFTFSASCRGVAVESVDEAEPPHAFDDTVPLSTGLVRMQTTAEPERESDFCDTEAVESLAANPHTYATWQTFPLHRDEHGLEGTLRVLQDSRFTGPGALRSGTNPGVRPCDPLPGRLEVLDAEGKVVDAWSESPQIDVTAHAFAPGQTVYQVRSLVLCLASCWCGDYLAFVRVVGGRLALLHTERASGEVAPVHGVSLGCYANAGIERAADGRPEIRIHRTVLHIPWAIAAEEHHTWDGERWRGSVVERRFPW
jgi:hypothetical protein